MTKEDDPYLSFVGVMQEEGAVRNTSPYLIGEVKSTEPLVVRTEEVELTREDMLINEFLLTAYKRKLRLDITQAEGVSQSSSGGSGSGSDSYASHNHGMNTIGIPDGTFTTLEDFAIGDLVLLLMSSNQQQFILVCKLR